MEMFPYGGTTSSEDKKIESCVNKLMEKGRNKVSAIKICKSSILKNIKEEKMDKNLFAINLDEKLDQDSISFAKERIIKGIPVFKTGEYKDKKYTTKDLDEMVSNFKILKEKADFDPPVRIGHRSDDDPVKDALNLIGYTINLYREGDTLFADAEITEPKGYEKIKNKTLRKRSSEIGPYEDNEGNEYEKTFWGFGWVDIPQVENLPLLEVAVYSKDKKTDFVAEAKKIIEEFQNSKKIYKESHTKKIMAGLKQCLDTAIGREDYSDAKSLSEMLSNLKYMLNREDYKEASMSKEKKFEKEEEETSEEEKSEEAEENTEEEETEKPEAEEEGKNEEEEEESEEEEKEETFAKKEEIDKMEKEDLKREIAKYQKEKEKTNMDKRMEMIESFKKEGKTTAAIKNKEKEFVKTLSDEQTEKYFALKKEQPKFVHLDKELGKGSDNEPKTGEETKQAEKEKYQKTAKKLVAEKLRREGNEDLAKKVEKSD